MFRTVKFYLIRISRQKDLIMINIHKFRLVEKMSLSSKTTVQMDWLIQHLGDADIIIADCRYNLMDSSEGRKKYLSGHIPGAYFVDMEADLTGNKKEHGGRHPIPDTQDFARRMSSMGVEKGKTVIAYDDDLSGASRLWWLLNYFGHDDVYVLDGGIGKWIKGGGKTTQDLPKEQHGQFRADTRHDLLYDMHTLKKRAEDEVIVDSRAPDRYLGNEEPIDFKAGHIPGAVNVFYRDIMESTGTLKTRDELRRIFRNMPSSPVVYCGSGITSCVNVLGMAIIGMEPKLYSGSWSDWITYPENGVATGSEF